MFEKEEQISEFLERVVKGFLLLADIGKVVGCGQKSEKIAHNFEILHENTTL